VPLIGLLPKTLFAQEPLPDFQHDPVEYWAGRILTWALITATVLVFFALVRTYRRNMSGVATRGLLVVSIVVLPAFSVASGMLLVFARAEKVEFCGSCHRALETYIEQMRDPQSEGLAAIHYKYQYIAANQCYECHTSYGLFGTVKAKVHGVRQVLRYYSNSYEQPLEMWKPYSNADCLKCHALSVKWRSHREHGAPDKRQAILTDQVSCMECHGEGHPAPAFAARRSP
jgi:nitrate/TMAO reductase-like tetraheme cytochrome c subunit